jgi:hypothetical protein
MLATYLSQQTNPQDLTLTDLQWQKSPFRYWDQFGINWVADRLAFYGVNTLEQLQAKRETYEGQVARTLYLHQSQGKASDDLLQRVRTEGHLLHRQELSIPVDSEPVSCLLRPIYWWRDRTGHGTLGNDAVSAANSVVVLELYQLE